MLKFKFIKRQQLLKSVWDRGAFMNLDYSRWVTDSHFVPFLKKSPSMSAVYQNAAALVWLFLPTTKHLLTFLRHRLWVDDWTFIFEWTVPLSCTETKKLSDGKDFWLGVTGSILKLVMRSSSATVPCSRSTSRPLRHKIKLKATCQ